MNDRGSITLWLLGAMMTILVVGLFATEISLSFAARRTVAAVADSAATQAASHVSLESATSGEPRLDVEQATEAAWTAAQSHPLFQTGMIVEVAATPERVDVRVTTERSGGPISRLVGGGALVAAATGTAHPDADR